MENLTSAARVRELEAAMKTSEPTKAHWVISQESRAQTSNRVKSVRRSMSSTGVRRGRGYNRHTTVEAVNGLELLRDSLKGLGQQLELKVITAEKLYPW